MVSRNGTDSEDSSYRNPGYTKAAVKNADSVREKAFAEEFELAERRIIEGFVSDCYHGVPRHSFYGIDLLRVTD